MQRRELAVAPGLRAQPAEGPGHHEGGLLLHPTRDPVSALRAVSRWVARHGIAVVAAKVVRPLALHATFNRPLVLSAGELVEIDVLASSSRVGNPPPAPPEPAATSLAMPYVRPRWLVRACLSSARGGSNRRPIVHRPVRIPVAAEAARTR